MRIYICAGEYESEGSITEEGNLTHEAFKLALEVGKNICDQYGYVDKFVTSPYLQARETTKALREACRRQGEHPSVRVDVKLSKRISPSMEGRLTLTAKTKSYDPPFYETREEFQQRAKRQYREVKRELEDSDELIVYVTHRDFLSVVTKKPGSSISLRDPIILRPEEGQDPDSPNCERGKKNCHKKEKKCDCRSECRCKVKCKCEFKCKCIDKCRCKKRCKCNEIISPYPPGVQPSYHQSHSMPCPQPCFCCPPRPCPPPCSPPCPPSPCPPVTIHVQYQQPPCDILSGVCPDSPFIKKTLAGKTCCYCYQVSCVCR